MPVSALRQCKYVNFQRFYSILSSRHFPDLETVDNLTHRDAIPLSHDENRWCFFVEYYYIVLSKDEHSPDCGVVIKNYLNNTVRTRWNTIGLAVGQEVRIRVGVI
jgi:hypothetical protein